MLLARMSDDKKKEVENQIITIPLIYLES